MSKSVDTRTASQIVAEATSNFSFEAVTAQMNFLQGNVLTIVDAAFTDPIQRKAVKDLVKAQFIRQINWIAEMTDLKEGRFAACSTQANTK